MKEGKELVEFIWTTLHRYKLMNRGRDPEYVILDHDTLYKGLYANIANIDEIKPSLKHEIISGYIFGLRILIHAKHIPAEGQIIKVI